MHGKVIGTYTNISPKVTIVSKSNQTRKTYTFYLERRAIYVPHRYPSGGEAVKVLFINERGALKGDPSGDSPGLLNLS